ncbi:hypothetical protein HZC00_04705 [Candidatus Kaiserbacteria bacterium]|nr:hypothetical protein [Candidatus Kaiserbacteria bacterium]
MASRDLKSTGPFVDYSRYTKTADGIVKKGIDLHKTCIIEDGPSLLTLVTDFGKFDEKSVLANPPWFYLKRNGRSSSFRLEVSGLFWPPKAKGPNMFLAPNLAICGYLIEYGARVMWVELDYEPHKRFGYAWLFPFATPDEWSLANHKFVLENGWEQTPPSPEFMELSNS